MNRSKYVQRAIISSVEGDRLEAWRAAGRAAARNRRRSVWNRAAWVGLAIDFIPLGVLALICCSVAALIGWSVAAVMGFLIFDF